MQLLAEVAERQRVEERTRVHDEPFEPAKDLSGARREADRPAARLVGQADVGPDRDARVERERLLGRDADQQPELGAERRVGRADRARHPRAKRCAGGVGRDQHVAEAEAQGAVPAVAGLQRRAEADDGVGRRGRDVAAGLHAEAQLALPLGGHDGVDFALDANDVIVGRILAQFDAGCPVLETRRALLDRGHLAFDVAQAADERNQCVAILLLHALQLCNVFGQPRNDLLVGLVGLLELVDATPQILVDLVAVGDVGLAAIRIGLQVLGARIGFRLPEEDLDVRLGLRRAAQESLLDRRDDRSRRNGGRGSGRTVRRDRDQEQEHDGHEDQREILHG